MTPTQKTAMQQALEALTEFTGSMTLGQRYSNAEQMALDALPALREALAEPVVEPAFWMNEFGQMCATRGFAERSWPGQKLTPLYTSPPQPADANDDLLLFAALVATHERERCAALVASWNTAMTDKLAREIRASADHPTTNERE